MYTTPDMGENKQIRKIRYLALTLISCGQVIYIHLLTPNPATALFQARFGGSVVTV